MPSCLNPAKETLLSSMKSTIDAYLAFMQNKDALVVGATLLSGSIGRTSFNAQVKEAEACAPLCPSLSK